MEKDADPVKIIRDEINHDLDEHGFEQTSDEDLKRYLIAMCKVAVNDDSVRQRYLLRGFTINHLQIARLIKSLDEKNSKTELWFMVLAIGSLIIGGLGLLLQFLGLIVQIVIAFGGS